MAKCSCNIHINSLWSIWYCLIGLGAETYLVYIALARLDDFRNSVVSASNALLSSPACQDLGRLEIWLYYGFIGLSILFAIFFALTALFKMNNFANDGEKLGRLVARVVSSSSSQATFQTTRSGGVKCWRHLPPLSSICHVIAAFCLLLPYSLMESKNVSCTVSSSISGKRFVLRVPIYVCLM